MNVLLLSEHADDYSKRIEDVIAAEDRCRWVRGPLSPGKLEDYGLMGVRFDWAVSYRYYHLLKSDVLAMIPAINLHASYLPWNRGADPNLWSWVDSTPKGVSIHKIDPGIDTGPVYAQRKVQFSQNETLASSYDKLQTALLMLFIEKWPLIKRGALVPVPQSSKGTYHSDKDRKSVSLPHGWETAVQDLAHASSTA